MALLNHKRYLELRLIDIDGTPASGRTLISGTNVLTTYFTRDGVPCTDALSLDSTNMADGRYIVEYVPSVTGHDYIEIYDPSIDIRVIDSEDVYDVSALMNQTVLVSELTQDFGGVGRLKPVVTSPLNSTLYIFNSSDWDAGKTIPMYAIAATGLDINGNWTSTPISVIHGKYHIVVIGLDGSKTVIGAYLEV